MNWYNWLIVIVPIIFVMFLSCYCRRYVRDVVDYLSAERVAGRYLLATGDMVASLQELWENKPLSSLNDLNVKANSFLVIGIK